jgi:hypothetical protein
MLSEDTRCRELPFVVRSSLGHSGLRTISNSGLWNDLSTYVARCCIGRSRFYAVEAPRDTDIARNSFLPTTCRRQAPEVHDRAS